MKNEPRVFNDDGGKRKPTRDPSYRIKVGPIMWGHRQSREPFLLGIGLRYVVDPLNPQARKHRGRPCEIFELDDDFMPDRAAVRFLDASGRQGTVNVHDLRPLNAQESANLGTATWAPQPAPIPVARTPGLDRTRFAREDSRSRPPREDVEKLWNAAAHLDSPELASDPSTTFIFGELQRVLKLSPQRLGQADTVRWLPSYDELPCRWWGSPKESAFYRLAVRAYEPDGTLACLQAMLTKEDVGEKTGLPVGRSRTKWPRPYHTGGLLLADEVGAAALRGEPSPNLVSLIVTEDIVEFLLATLLAFEARRRVPGIMGVVGISTGTTLEIFKQVRWPKDVLCLYSSPDTNKDSTPALRRLRASLGPSVLVDEFRFPPKARDGHRPEGSGEAVPQVAIVPSAPFVEVSASEETQQEENPSDSSVFARSPTRGPRPSDWTGTVSRTTDGVSYTYVFRFGSSDIWKIGWTANLEARLADVRKHVPVELTRENWMLVLRHSHPSQKDAYDMEQHLFSLVEKHRTEGERIRCSEAEVQNAWALAVHP